MAEGNSSRGNETRLRKCKSCRTYTLKETCPSCGGKTISPHPPKFSPLDPYGKYRRILKKQLGGT